MNADKRKYLYDKIRSHGFDHWEAIRYLEYNDRCNWESITRQWRFDHPEEDKNMARAEEMRKEYSIHETAKKLKEDKDPNYSLNL